MSIGVELVFYRAPLLRVFYALLPLAGAVSSAVAAIQPPPAEKPKEAPPSPPADESPDTLPEELRKVPAAPRARDGKSVPAITIPSPVDPKSGASPSVRDAASGVPSTRRLTEGAFLLRRSGRMLRAPTGDWIFVPVRSDAGFEDRPMVIVPSAILERIESAMTAAAGQQYAVELSGQVLSYRDREYLLAQQPSSVHTAAESSAPETGLARPATPDPANTPTPGEDQAVQDLIRDLEAMRSESKSVSPSRSTPRSALKTTESGASEAPVARALVPEGTLVTGRRGRIVRTAGGELCFAADSDTDGIFDRPMILAPCQTLKRIEDLVRWRGDEFVLSVSGRVLAYQGRNYFLPTMFVVPAPSDVDPLQ